MLKVTTILILTTFVTSFAILCASYRLSYETNNVFEEVTDAPKYHIRIDIMEIKDNEIRFKCFGALVHLHYAVAVKEKCLNFYYLKNFRLKLFAAAKELIDMNDEGIIPTSVSCSQTYNIGVVYVEGNIAKVENNDRMKDVMNMDIMNTIIRHKAKDCFHVEDYSLFVSTQNSNGVTAMDIGSPIVYMNKEGKDRLVALVIAVNEDCTSGNTVLLGLELNHKEIANELYQLSNKSIPIRK